MPLSSLTLAGSFAVLGLVVGCVAGYLIASEGVVKAKRALEREKEIGKKKLAELHDEKQEAFNNERCLLNERNHIRTTWHQLREEIETSLLKFEEETT